ncbi:hypothetical protein [Komagataeibacter oboediens]|uniref:hypothetical protein n=1 Tax=Komagataeibacter oboediens TaxID=65958 RepID=UPI0011B6C425|nr:hypothetical protein [Komagataeibacter oboediens]
MIKIIEENNLDSLKRDTMGIYIIRSINAPNVIRIGYAGAIKLYRRIKDHGRKWSGKKLYGTHECAPFKLIIAWELYNWDIKDVKNAEKCLYRHIVIRFNRYNSLDKDINDNSLFYIEDDKNIRIIYEDVLNDLYKMEHINSLS